MSRAKSIRSEAICKTCGKIYLVPPWLTGKKFCSRFCYRSPNKQVSKACRRCNTSFLVYPSEVRKGSGIYCSRVCYFAHTIEATKENFWSQVDKTGDCWLWQGHSNKAGYGVYGSNYQRFLAHRFSWIITNGEIDGNLFVLHHCDNPPCVNPSHLFLGTQADNVADKVCKGRQDKGEKHGRSKLTESQVRTMIADYSSGIANQKELAEKFGITRNQAHLIIRGKLWKHI